MSRTRFSRAAPTLLRWFVTAVALVSFAAPSLSDPAALVVGRPSGTKAAPYLPTTAAGATTVPFVVPPGQVVIDGKGFGHGVGLAQDGAYWMGKAGKTSTQIIAHFFPGTVLAKQGGLVRVPLGTAEDLTLRLPEGGVVEASGEQLKVRPGGGVRVVALGGSATATVLAELPTTTRPTTAAPTTIAADPGSGRFGAPVGVEAPAPVPAGVTTAVTIPDGRATEAPQIPTSGQSQSATQPTVASTEVGTLPVSSLQPKPDNGVAQPTVASPGPSASRSVTAGTVRVVASVGGVVASGDRRYRGTFELKAASRGMRIVNELDVEWYLRGMAEVTDPHWSPAALQSQAIVARTFALWMMQRKGEVCPTQACQVYVGAQVEFPEQNAAVEATAHKVVQYKGQLAETYYSASGGGTIADPAEVFGAGKVVPYLKAGTYPTGDPKAWRIELSLAELSRRVGYPGTLYDVVVSTIGPSGRAVEITFSGSAGARVMSGPVFDRVLGLRSTNFSLIVGRSVPSTTRFFGSSTVPLANQVPISPPSTTGVALRLDGGVATPGALDYQTGSFDDDAPFSSDGSPTDESGAQPSAIGSSTTVAGSTVVPPTPLPSTIPPTGARVTGPTDAPSTVEDPAGERRMGSDTSLPAVANVAAETGSGGDARSLGWLWWAVGLIGGTAMLAVGMQWALGVRPKRPPVR